MKAVENLRAFIEDAERSELYLSREQIESLGNDLLQAAETRAGYEEVVWQAGVYLLLSISTAEGVDDFYQRYGYQTVANALHATFANGDFPLGLGFIVNDFLPSDGLRGLAQHASIHQALATLTKEQLRVPIENFLTATPKLLFASAQFLGSACTFVLPLSYCLQISSSLLIASFNNDEEREPAMRLFLDFLAAEDRDVNLFYCWRAAIEKHPVLANENAYLSILPRIIKRCRDMDDKGIAILEQLLNDEQLESYASNETSLLLLLGLAEWWLYVRKNCQRQDLMIAWQLIWDLKGSSPALHEALKNFLEDDLPQVRLPEEIEDLQKEFQHVMQALHAESRLRTYRGVPLAIKIYRYNLIQIFEPLYEALEGSSALPDRVIQQIRTLDAQTLIDDNPLQREARFEKKIVGELRSNMIEDLKTIIQLLQRALQLRLQLSENLLMDEEIASSLSTEDVKREVNDLCRRYPDLRWTIEWFLPETVSAT